jgi:hypothetical protein
VTGFVHSPSVIHQDLVRRPPQPRTGRTGDVAADPEADEGPRPTPREWARRRREEKQVRRVEAGRERTKTRLNRLGDEWELIDAATLGLPAVDAFLAIGPGGVFAVTVKSQGRNRVLLSGDTVQINGRRPDFLGEARRLAAAMSRALSKSAGLRVPITPVLALAGSGPISVFGLPRGCVVMPYRELDNLLRAYGERIAPRTVDKLASIARHPATAIDVRGNELVSSYTWHSGVAPADKKPGSR